MSILTESARGQSCQGLIPGVCRGETDTVVFAHLNKLELGSGVAIKVFDYLGAFLCQRCHSHVDGLKGDPILTENMFYRAAFRTLIIMVNEGVLLKYLLKLEKKK